MAPAGDHRHAQVIDVDRAARRGNHSITVACGFDGEIVAASAIGSAPTRSAARTNVTGDLKNRCGQVVGVEVSNAVTMVRAVAPLSELGRYASQLRSITGGLGSFVMELSHDDIVPHAVQQKIAGECRPGAEEP
jgi:hypothetical protein